MATKTKTLEVLCPFCMDADAKVSLDLNDLDACTCSGCDETFSPGEAAEKFVELANQWSKVARWLDTAPVA
jgi:hypothetical protein